MIRRVAVVSVLVALAAAAGAGAAWSPAVRVSAPGTLSALRVGADARGNTTFAWLRRSGDKIVVTLRRRSAQGRLGRLVTRSAPGRPKVMLGLAVAPGGSAVAIWSAQGKTGPVRIRALSLSANGAPGPVINVTDVASRRSPWPQVVVDENGDAVLMWTQNVGKSVAVMARRWPAHGGLGPVTDVSAATPSTGFNPPSVAIDADGDALFAWEASDGHTNVRIVTRPWPHGASPGASAVVSRPGDYSQKPHVVLAADGSGVVAWGASPHDRAAVVLHARRTSSSGVLGPIRELGIGDFNAGLALAPDGTVFATGSFDIDPEGEVRAATLSPADALVTTENSFTSDYQAVQVAARPGGALLVWSQRGAASVIARSLSPAGELGAPERVSPPRRPTREPAIAIGPGGAAQVAWVGGRGSGRVVETSAGP
ncbi:MAG: hypothetical protein QOJ46_2354 [bacterium]